MSDLDELWEELGMGMSDCDDEERERRKDIMFELLVYNLPHTPSLDDKETLGRAKCLMLGHL